MGAVISASGSEVGRGAKDVVLSKGADATWPVSGYPQRLTVPTMITAEASHCGLLLTSVMFSYLKDPHTVLIAIVLE